MCCALNCVLKCVMMVVNSLLLIMGIVLMVIGSLLLWGFSYAMKGVYAIEENVTIMLHKFGVSGNGKEVLNLMQANSYTIGAISFGVGVLLIAFAILGIVFVACCNLRLLLIIIVSLVVIISLALIILIGVFGVNKTEKVLNPLAKYIQKGVINKYKGLKETNAESILVNFIQISLKCCGLTNHTDFNSASKFKRDVKNAHGTNVQLQFPITCCDYKSTYTIDGAVLEKCITDGTSSRKENGCWTKVKPHLEKYLGYCFTTIGITIGVLIAVIIAGIVSIYCLEKAP